MNSVLHTINGWKWRNGMIFMIAFLWPVCTLAQNEGAASVVILKNDLGLTEIHGTLIPVKDSSKIAIRTRDRNVWVFSRSDVKKISRENPVFPSTPHGWYNTTTFGVYFGDENGYQLQSTVGYRFHYRYYTGIGVALDHYSIRSLPVFIDLRADLLRKKTTPFAYTDIGLTNPWPKKSQYEFYKRPDKKIPGWYVNAGVGWRFRSRKSDHSWQFSLGYSLETMKMRYLQPIANPGFPEPDTQTQNIQIQDFKYTFNRFVVKAGFTL